ncbi:MAG: HAMP domain-containing histidine kinase [Deltaproteobacteria bacterium]|nr:HAMP domain-containing histidine kinase [Deltaproteobacteria bacterium]
MQDLYQSIVTDLRSLMARILEPKLDMDDFLSHVARAAKELEPGLIEARVYEVDFIENRLFLRASSKRDMEAVDPEEKSLVIKPQTITGDAVIEDRVIIASRVDGYATTRFKEGEYARAAFPIEFTEEDVPEDRTKYVLVVDKKEGAGPFSPDVVAALKDYSALAGLIISIKEYRDKLSQYYDENRNLVLSGRHSTSIAHDIRSLNVGVSGFLNLILKRLKKSPEAFDLKTEKKSLIMARDNSRQIETLLKNFSLFNQPELTLHRDMDLVQAVRDKLASLQRRADYERKVAFEMHLPEDECGFLVDKDWFGTVVENLIRNSVEACGRNCHIVIRLEKTPDRVLLTFEDNCQGIPSHILPRIFTPFVSGKKRGQGLGLANARKVVEDHNGSISVANIGKRGAIFTIEFTL